ncbi:glycoside hydrolase family 61 protein [Roridomyces roridus]|uniref:lytic cellulose monooxygenase (C4-dehydrogenating) n=1 Tax=Roridomyces roridus TaxID=1738132 RepID=A0AAD7FX52_9AGAR|nr:glycoside hydrolase family 61 protein [Roridomyces roridus]
MKFAVLSALIIPVAGHGWVGSIAVAGKTYQGNGLGTSGSASCIRQVDTNSPVTSVSDPNLACGPNAQLAQDVANANPGDSIDVNWVSTAGAWFHDVGPLLTYLASCGSASCTQFDASQAMWFKIQQSGRDANGWVQAELNSGAPANFTLPANLAPGNYLLRHEIIALQNGVSPGGAEFYASCSQLVVAGSESGGPTQSELVKLPGAYSATDPGILVDVYTNPNAPYTFPGPPIAAFVAQGGGGGNAPASPATTPAQPQPSAGTTSPSKTPTLSPPAAPSASGTCVLRRNVLTPKKQWHRSLRNLAFFSK